MNDPSAYLALPYTKTIRRDEDGDFVARVMELSGCVAHGSSETEALANLLEVQAAWIDSALAAGLTVPAPDAEDALPSGRWLQRVPRTLHRKLVDLARSEGVSLNQYVVAVLAEAAGDRAARDQAQRSRPVTRTLGTGGLDAIQRLYPMRPDDVRTTPADGNLVFTVPNIPFVFSDDSILEQTGTWAHATATQSRALRATARTMSALSR